MIYDAVLAFFEAQLMFLMGVMSVAFGSPPDWTIVGTNAVSAVMQQGWAFSYWVPFEWMVPVALAVATIRFPLFVFRVIVIIYNAVFHAGV